MEDPDTKKIIESSGVHVTWGQYWKIYASEKNVKNALLVANVHIDDKDLRELEKKLNPKNKDYQHDFMEEIARLERLGKVSGLTTYETRAAVPQKRDPLLEQYVVLRKAFDNGDMSKAMRLFEKWSDNFQGSDTTVHALMMGVIAKSRPGYRDHIMAEKLLAYKLSQPHADMDDYTDAFKNFDKAVNFYFTSSRALQKPVDQLWILEEAFKNNPKAEIKPLQEAYMNALTQCLDDDAAKQFVATSELLQKGDGHKRAIELFATSSKMFGLVDYMVNHPEHALLFMKNKAIKNVLEKHPIKITHLIEHGGPELREAVRNSGVKLRKDHQELLKVSVEADILGSKENPEILQNPFFQKELKDLKDLNIKGPSNER